MNGRVPPALVPSGVSTRKRRLLALIYGLGVVAPFALAPASPAAAQEAAPSESGAADADDDSLDALLNESGQQPASEEAAPPRQPEPTAVQPATAEPTPATATAPPPAPVAATEAPLETIPLAEKPTEASQPFASKKKPVQIEEIVVTAQKRTELLNKVPIAISAFDQDSMEKLGSQSISDSISLVPNLQNSTGGFAIRGVGSSSISHTSPTVAIHVDGIYVDDDPRGLQGNNWDVTRVEVLRGPQGTLYGRNATAGVINIITAKPSNEFEAFGDLSWRTGNERLARFVVNQPLSDALALRLAASVVKSDGLQENPVSGESNGGATDAALARLAARWSPTEAVLWDANVEYTRSKGVDSGFQEDWYASKPDKQTAIVYPSGLPKDQVAPQGPSAEQFGSFADRNSGLSEKYALRSNLRYEFSERWAVTWLAGYKEGESQANNNSLPLALVDHGLRGNDAKAVFEIYSHELNLNFEGERSHGVAGLYYARKSAEDDDVLHIWTPTGSAGPEAPPRLATAADLARQSFEPSLDTSQAVFGQFTFDLRADLRLTGGLRYTQDKARLGAGRSTLCQFGEFSSPDQQPSLNCQLLDASNAFGGVFGPTELPRAEQSWSALSWKAIVDYDIGPDLLSYATVSTGYKQGSITGQDVEGIHSVKPETNTNYEGGLRWQLFDGGANLGLTAFWMDYVDLQVNTSENVGGAPTLSFTNIGKARLRGVETELSWQLTEADRIDGFVTYLDAVIKKYPNAPDPLRGAAFTFDAAGNKPSAAPRSTFRLAYSHSFDLGSWGGVTPTLSTYHASDSYLQVTNGPQDHEPAYWRSDFFLHYASPDDRFTLDAFVNNIEDHRTRGSVFAYLTEASDPDPTNPLSPAGSPGGGIQWAVYSPGRLIGLRLGIRF